MDDLGRIAAGLRRERVRLAGERDRLDVALGEATDVDTEDPASSLADRALGGSVEETVDHVLRQIDAALAKIDDGTYGSCERCGQPIAAARLDALPYAVRCVDCAALEG